MAEKQAGAAVGSGLVQVECVVSLRHDDDYLFGRQYELSPVFLAQYPENFRPVGWRLKVAIQRAEAEQEFNRQVSCAQDDFERARDHQEKQEVQAEIELARARRERGVRLQEVAEAQEQEAQTLIEQLPVVIPPSKAPPVVPAEPPSEPPAKTAGPSGSLPRAERLRRAAT